MFQVMSQGKVRDTLIGTTYLPLAEIARMKALRVDPEECDIVSLPLHRPSGRPQGYIRLSIIVKGISITTSPRTFSLFSSVIDISIS